MDLRKIFYLQIETRLENPTKYHVLESQKRQVAEYLSESGPETSAVISTAAAAATTAGGATTTAGSRRTSGPFSPSYSSAATSPSEYTPSEVSRPLSWDYLIAINDQWIPHIFGLLLAWLLHIVGHKHLDSTRQQSCKNNVPNFIAIAGIPTLSLTTFKLFFSQFAIIWWQAVIVASDNLDNPNPAELMQLYFLPFPRKLLKLV